MSETVRFMEPDRIRGLDGKMRPARRGGNAKRDARILELRSQGLSLRAIAAETDCSYDTAARVIRQAREAVA